MQMKKKLTSDHNARKEIHLQTPCDAASGGASKIQHVLYSSPCTTLYGELEQPVQAASTHPAPHRGYKTRDSRKGHSPPSPTPGLRNKRASPARSSLVDRRAVSRSKGTRGPHLRTCFEPSPQHDPGVGAAAGRRLVGGVRCGCIIVVLDVSLGVCVCAAIL